MVTELRVNGLLTVEKANKFLNSYIKEFNNEFFLPIKNTKSLFEKRPCEEKIVTARTCKDLWKSVRFSLSDDIIGLLKLSFIKCLYNTYMELFEKEFNLYKNSTNSINEDCIEKALICFLCNQLGFIYRNDITNSEQLKANFRQHYEKLNDYRFDDKEFNSFWIEFNHGDVFDRFLTLKSKPYEAKKNNKHDRTLKYFDYDNVDNNVFEVTNQLWTKDNTSGLRRFDINILINGIPTIHIELKNEKEDVHCASKQIRTYKDIEAIGDFLNFTKIFIVSNGAETLYLSNNNDINHNFAFKWTDKNNMPFNEIIDFSANFLKKDFLIKFLANYFVYDVRNKLVKVFRPYQYHACELIIDKVLKNESNESTSGYIWHATGSGKTMTSFKASERLANLKEIDRVIFIIDRVDLNIQTLDNFQHYTTSDGLVRNAVNSNNLVELLCNPSSNKKIIITTIQKLNNVLSETETNSLDFLRDKKIVFMVDEGHRSQLGVMRRNINKFFKNAINFAFTGTPIFDRNAKDGKTTENIFGKMIHKYTSYNAIVDRNVLPLTLILAESVESQKNESGTDYDDELEENISNQIQIDIGAYQEKVKYILHEFNNLTKNKMFNAMLACSSIQEAMVYYNMFKLQDNELKIAIIFSINKSDYSSQSEVSDSAATFLAERIKEHNATWDLQSADKYKSAIQKEFSKDRKYDLLIVVSMFLTGFDSPVTNTLFLDKKLRYQNLIQAISRTNRLHTNKDTGYIVSFKNNQATFDEALALYTNGGINTPLDPLWTMQTYKDLCEKFSTAIFELLQNFPDVDDVYNLTEGEEKLIQFFDLFKKVNTVMNEINPMPEFKWSNFKMDKRLFDQYKGAFKTKLEASKAKNIIYTYNDYEIVINGTVEINKDYLKNLLYEIASFNTADGNDYKQSAAYNKIKANIIEMSSNSQEKDWLMEFIDNKKLYTGRSYSEIIALWTKYINEKIQKEEARVIADWKATSKAIKELMEEFKVKKHLNNFDFVSGVLPNHIKNEIDDDYKMVEVQNVIIKLSVLYEIKNLVL